MAVVHRSKKRRPVRAKAGKLKKKPKAKARSRAPRVKTIEIGRNPKTGKIVVHPAVAPLNKNYGDTAEWVSTNGEAFDVDFNKNGTPFDCGSYPVPGTGGKGSGSIRPDAKGKGTVYDYSVRGENGDELDPGIRIDP